MKDMYNILQNAIADFEDRLKEKEESDEIWDIIHEVADYWVPIYYHNILQVALSDLSLAIREPEIWPAFNGDNTPVNLIAANIYEWIVEALRSHYNEKKE